MPLEILNGAFAFLRRSFCLERAEIPSFSRVRIFLARIQSILPGFEFPDHVPSIIRRPTGLRVLDCRAIASVGEHRQAGGAPALQRLARTLKPECEQAGENRQIGRQVSRKAPVLAGVTKTAAGNVQSANFGCDGGEREDQDQCS
jgi:hypothetical protein